jgi:hypothetical protein
MRRGSAKAGSRKTRYDPGEAFYIRDPLARPTRVLAPMLNVKARERGRGPSL